MRQNQYPFNASVEAPPGSVPLLFDEQFRAGVGTFELQGDRMPGAQFPPARFLPWAPDPAAQFLQYVDTLRQGLVIATAPPVAEYAWTGEIARTSQWPTEEAFSALLFTRVGVPVMDSAIGEGGIAGAIVSLAGLKDTEDGPFIALGIRERSTGWEASFSKWSDSATLVDEFFTPCGAPSIYLRCGVEVDPEDGLTLGKAQWSIDGWGWSLFTNNDEVLLLEGAHTSFDIGFGATGYNAGIEPRTMSGVADCLQVIGPAQTDIETIALRLGTQGGRNWP